MWEIVSLTLFYVETPNGGTNNYNAICMYRRSGKAQSLMGAEKLQFILVYLMEKLYF